MNDEDGVHTGDKRPWRELQVCGYIRKSSTQRLEELKKAIPMPDRTVDYTSIRSTVADR